MSKQRQRMSARYCKRAKITEQGVTISFGFSTLVIAIISGLVESLPYVGGFATLGFFYFHRTVLVTDQHVYVYRDLPFHRPGEMLAMYPLGADTVVRVRGKLTFADGTTVWHAPFFAWRVRQVADAIQSGSSTQTMAAAY
jgi:hypothetical protein